MELKQYQQEVINDLTTYIDFLERTENLNKALLDLAKSGQVKPDIYTVILWFLTKKLNWKVQKYFRS